MKVLVVSKRPNHVNDINGADAIAYEAAGRTILFVRAEPMSLQMNMIVEHWVDWDCLHSRLEDGCWITVECPYGLSHTLLCLDLKSHEEVEVEYG